MSEAGFLPCGFPSVAILAPLLQAGLGQARGVDGPGGFSGAGGAGGAGGA